MNYLTAEQSATYSNLEKLAQRIQDAVQEFDRAVLDSDIPNTVKVKCLGLTTELKTQGLAYRLHPQSEWTGGNSFQTRTPHIANEL